MRRRLVLFLLVFAGYAAGSQLAFSWFGAEGTGASFFPAAGVTLAALVLVDRSRWWIVLSAAGLAEFTVDMIHDLGVLPSLGYAVANTAQPLVGALLLMQGRRRVDLARRRDLWAFVGYGVVTAAALGAVLGASTYVLLAGGAGWARFASQWWIGDGLGVLVAGGAILSLAAGEGIRLPAPRVVEAAALAMVCTLATLAVFWLDWFPLVFVPIALLIGIAFRAGTAAVAITSALVAVVAAESTAEGHPYWEVLGVSPAVGMIYLQATLAVVAVTGLALAAEIHERELAVTGWASAEAAKRESDQSARRAEHLRSLAEQLAGSATPDGVGVAFLQEALAQVGASAGVLMLAGDGGSTLRIVARCGDTAIGERWDPVPINGPYVTSAAFVSAAPVTASSREEIERRFPGTASSLPQQVQAMVALPLRAFGGPVGVFSLAFDRSQKLSGDDLALLSTMASVCGPALERAQLFAAERAARRHVEQLERHAGHLAAARTAEEIGEATVADLQRIGAATVLVFERRGSDAELLDSGGLPDDLRPALARVPLGTDHPVAAAIRGGATVEVTPGDAPSDPAVQDVIGRLRLRTFLTAPLRALDGRIVGALAAGPGEQEDAPSNVRELLSPMAEQVGRALERLRAEEALRRREAAEREARRRVELLAEVISELEAVPGVAERAQRLVELLVPRAADCARIELSLESGPLVAMAPHDRVPEVVCPQGDGIGPDATGDGAALVTVPLDLGAELHGELRLAVLDPDRPRFSADDVAFLEELADRVGVVVASARIREEEHLIALRLQQALLPGEVLRHSDVAIAARYDAGSDVLEVGGDWYDTFALPDGRIGLAVGDVVGHGLEAAAAMGRLRTALAALAPRAEGPGKLLAHLDDFASGPNGADFATACCAILDPATGLLRYASAGHPPMLVVTPAGRTVWLDGGHSQPLCGLGAGERPEDAIVLEPGALLVAYSDGLVERRDESLDAGLARLEAAARAGRDLEVGDVCDRLVAELGVNVERDDDVVVVCLRLTPALPLPAGDGRSPALAVITAEEAGQPVGQDAGRLHS